MGQEIAEFEDRIVEVVTKHRFAQMLDKDVGHQAIVIYTEPGGRMEAELARWVTRARPPGSRSSRSWQDDSWTRCRA